jgi:hypothetical protein
VGGGRGKYGKENPRRFYAVGLRTEPAPIVRGSSRRITIMRFRPANIRVISRRKNYLDHNPRCLPRARTKKKKQFLVVDRSFHIRTMVGTAQPLCLSASRTDRRRYDSTRNLRRRKNHSVSLHYGGWMARPFPLRFAVAGEVFVLTFLFIERDYRNVA